MSDEFDPDNLDIDKWLMNLEAEEDKNDPHYSSYFIPDYEKDD